MNDSIYKQYPFLHEREVVWREIVRYISRDCAQASSALEIGSGYGDFINQFPALKKTAIDLNPDLAQFYKPDVNFICADVSKIDTIIQEKYDLIFASNFLEHLNQDQLDHLLPQIHKKLNLKGQLILLQPNYRLCKKNYFDDETHQTIFSDTSIPEFLTKYGFEITKLIPGLLPFSMKSRLPKWGMLVRLYLNSPIRPLAAQMYIVTNKRNNHVEQ